MSPTNASIQADDLWAPRRQLSLSQARRRSKVVRGLRFGFSAAAAICLGVLVGLLTANAIERAASGGEDFRTEEKVTMVSPRFTGRDDSGDPYVITAATAQRRRANSNLVDLVDPKLVDAEGGEVLAPRGLYDRQLQTLELYDDVVMKDGGGYVFRSTHARVYIQEDRIVGLDPLEGEGPIGDVRADSYEVFNEGHHVVVSGRVRTVLYPEERPAEQAPSEQE